jgi:hypothetical protein
MQPAKTVYVLYEAGQVEGLESLLVKNPGIVVPLSPLIEEMLERQGIPYHSGRAHHPSDQQRFLDADAWVSSWVASPVWQWFTYRSVALVDLFSFSVQLYLVSLLYYTYILESIITTHSPTRLVVFPSIATRAPARRALEQKQARAVVACAHLVGASRGVVVEVPELAETPVRGGHVRAGSALKRVGIECSIRINNWVVGLRPRTTPRIVVSDYWRNIQPIASALPQGELVLFDRSEIMHAAWRDLWRLRVRLLNFNSFRSKARARDYDEVIHTFTTEWEKLRTHVTDCCVDAVSLKSLIVEMLRELVEEEAPRMLLQIDSAWLMLEKLRPDVVFLRVSVTSQPHFYILALVAKHIGIPSLELQHGLEYLGPGSISKRHGAEYVAVYGQVIQDEFAALGRSRDKTPIVGSPRFDAYNVARQQILPTRRPFTILCIGYGVGMEWFYDDYEIEEYYTALANVVRAMPEVSVIVKLRPGAFREEDCRLLVKRAFGDVPYTLVQNEQLSELFTQTHVVYSYYSTAILEALQFGKPVIAYSAQEMERTQIATHFTQYAKRGALVLAGTSGALEVALRTLQDPKARETMSVEARVAMERFQCFDGQASKRIITLIQTFVTK